MLKAEIFDIEKKKQAQRQSEMMMSPSERLILCLNLMDLYRSLRPSDQIKFHPTEEIQWIELFHKK
jgi:hypothetical protein